MAKSITQSAARGNPYPTSCEEIQRKIEAKNKQLSNWQAELEVLLNDTNSDVERIGIILNTIDIINKSLFALKADQRRLDCLPGGSSELLQDNQTIISTSSVRRKDARALDRKTI